MTTSDDLLASRDRVPDQFDRIATRYDLLASLSPSYRRDLRLSAARLAAPSGGVLLDLCAGTGLSTVALLAEHPAARVLAVDRSAGMLAHARRRVRRFGARVHVLEGDAMAVPLPAGSVAGILMAYGIRNVPDQDGCLAGLLELLRPGGSVCFHEYSVRDSAAAIWKWKAMSTVVIIPAGRVLTGTSEIFRYLRASVLAFDGVSAFCERLRAAGFVDVGVRPMPGLQRGITHSFVARRASTPL